MHICNDVHAALDDHQHCSLINKLAAQQSADSMTQLQV